jgi:cytochrome c oxidase assembly factor CtaG
MFFKTLKMFVVILLVSAAAVWISKNGGAVSVEWLGYRAATTVPVALIIMAALFWISSLAVRFAAFLCHPLGGRKKKEDEAAMPPAA